MGYWGGNNEDEANQLIEQQITENQAEIQRERQALSERKLSIIKTQGAPNWSPEAPPASGRSGRGGMPDKIRLTRGE